MNNTPTDNPDNRDDAAWEEAMSRDFDARVRDLHEAPLDMSSVKGKAHKIRRNRRAAVAGSILGVAAIVTPVAVLMDGGDTGSKEPQFAPEVSETAQDPADGIDYLQGRTWHQADGDEVQLPQGDYYEAAIWDGQLVTLTPAVEVFPSMSIFDETGNLVETLENTAGFAISSDGTILAYTTGDGDVITRWGDGPDEREVLATDVIDTAGGESYGGAPVSVIGTAPCVADSGNCLVRINTYTDGCRGIGTSDVPGPADARLCFDEQDGLLSYSDELVDDSISCGGVADADGVLWRGCDYEPGDISPSGEYVVGKPSQYDGLGFRAISILDAATGDETGRYAPEGLSSFIWSGVAWTTDDRLLFSAYDGANWHLYALSPDGTTEELSEPVRGDNVSNPWVLIRH